MYDLKHLFNLLPAVAAQAVHLPQLMKSATAVATKMALPISYEKTLNSLKNSSKDNIVICKILPHKNTLTTTGAELLLTLYFDQFSTNQSQTHIDFRSIHFSELNGTLYWHPSRLQYGFSNNFKRGMRSLYQGFYYDHAQQMEQGLTEVQLLPADASHSYRHELIELFLNHFGHARSGPIRLSMQHFKNSFSRIFDFFVKNKVVVPVDFAFLGIYLVTLYQHLDLLGLELNVAQCFKRSQIS